MPRMNGSEPRIEIFKPFGEAFELMKKILFQPFDLKKWLVVGFAAWLANLGGGGGGFNYRYNRREEMQKVNEALSQIPHSLLVTGICVLICFVVVLIVVFAWLRARGCFMFIDCIAKNRGAIAEPWRNFRNEGNSYFLFSLLVGFAFLIVLALATAIVACVATCATCCIAAIPYIGTVILLPVFVLLRSFSLLFLRQFGPDYDIWATFVPPEFLPVLSSETPMPPPPTSSLNPPPEPPSSPVA